MQQLVVVAVTTEQARLYAQRRGCAEDAVLIATGGRDTELPDGLLPTPRDVVLLEGWDRGRNARIVESRIQRVLSKRSGRFDQCQRDTAFAFAA